MKRSIKANRTPKNAITPQKIKRPAFANVLVCALVSTRSPRSNMMASRGHAHDQGKEMKVSNFSSAIPYTDEYGETEVKIATDHVLYSELDRLSGGGTAWLGCYVCTHTHAYILSVNAPSPLTAARTHVTVNEILRVASISSIWPRSLTNWMSWLKAM